MVNARKIIAKSIPKALACGMLQDNGRILFLIRKDAQGTERIELPSIEIFSGEDPVRKLASEFKRQTSIDAEVCEIKIEKRYNAGSRKRKNWVPCLVFIMRTKNMKVTAAPEFSGFKWLNLEDAKKTKLGRKAEWII